MSTPTTISATDALLIFGGLVGPSIASAALAGAVALGIAALVFRRRNRQLRHSHKHGGHGDDHHGGGYGSHSHGSYSYSGPVYDEDTSSSYGHKEKRRRRRQVIATEQEKMKLLLQLIRHQDVSGCGLKMVCELASLPFTSLSRNEREILRFVNFATPGNKFGEGAADYLKALQLGNAEANCTEVFTACPVRGNHIMEAVAALLP